MSYTFTIAGKGGVGKTTIASLLIHYLIKWKKIPILAVDADPNSNLNELLGIPLLHTLGEARNDIKKQNSNITKNLFIEMRVNQCIVENNGFDLIAMGRPEGIGCYCAANHLLTNCIDKLAKNYKCLVIDNEAGMEHISRITTQRIDSLLLISDYSHRGLITAQRIQKLALELKIFSGVAKLFISMVRNKISFEFLNMTKELGLKLAGVIPYNEELAFFDQTKNNINQFLINNEAVKVIYDTFDKEDLYVI